MPRHICLPRGIGSGCISSTPPFWVDRPCIKIQPGTHSSWHDSFGIPKTFRNTGGEGTEKLVQSHLIPGWHWVLGGGWGARRHPPGPLSLRRSSFVRDRQYCSTGAVTIWASSSLEHENSFSVGTSALGEEGAWGRVDEEGTVVGRCEVPGSVGDDSQFRMNFK